MDKVLEGLRLWTSISLGESKCGSRCFESEDSACGTPHDQGVRFVRKVQRYEVASWVGTKFHWM